MTGTTHTVFASELPRPDQMTDRQWVQLLPIGEARPVDGRGPWRVADAEAIVEASAPFLARGMPVDFNHAMESEDRTRHAPAAGWIERLEARPDGIWGEIAWTSEGREKIAGRVYRYISPVFAHDKARRVTAILRAGLTNTPALAMAAICTDMGAGATERPREDQGDTSATPEGRGLASATFETASEVQLRTFARTVLDRLGISASAPLQTALDRLLSGELEGQRSSATQSRPLDAFADLLLSRAQSDHKAEVERMVSDAQGRGLLPPALREWGVALASSDPASFRRFVASSPFKGMALDRQMLTGQPPGATPSEGNGVAAAICAQLGLKPGALN
jgi:phage I-like protein